MAAASCISLDGDAIALAAADGTSVRFWRSGGNALEIGTTDSPVAALALDSTGARLATVHDKAITLWDTAVRRALWRTVVPKRPSAVVFDGARVLFADKFGEVWSLAGDPHVDKTEAVGDAPILAGPEPVFELGHVSMLSAMILSAGRERRLVTADADKRIRVSAWPEGYQIEAFCMGSKAAQGVLAWARLQDGSSLLLSGGEDGALHAWDPASGEMLSLVHPADSLSQPPADAATAPSRPPAGAVRAVCAGLGPARAIVAVALASSPSRLALYALEQPDGGRATLRACGTLELPDAPAAVCALHASASGALWVVCARRLLLHFEPAGSEGFSFAARHEL